MAIAAVSVAGSALVSCWIPFLNVYAFIMCPVVLVLAVAALVSAKRKPRLARVLAVVSIGVSVLAVVLAWNVNSWAAKAFDKTPGSPQTQQGSEQPSSAEPRGLPGDSSSVLPERALEQILAEPVVPPGVGAQLGDFEVRLLEVDRDATDRVQQRSPSAVPLEGAFVLFEFEMRYDGGLTGEPDFTLVPGFVGTDGRSYSAVDCSTGLSIEDPNHPGLQGEYSGNYDICFDLPPEALGDNSRVVLRMPDVFEELYWEP
ncbi:hypothetical protein [Arthrobacter sp. 7Tela_A1]|uniref:hypothetical protein n=1 Tax=Arthrobacter sp. 7Tela_A1 TaxID=3093745 RepID=UPI003BB5790C